MEPNALMPADVAGWCDVHSLHDPQLIEDIWKVVRLVDQHRMTAYRDAQNASSKGGKK
jgi:hypothetical protein